MMIYVMACITCGTKLESRRVYATGCIGGSDRWVPVCAKCKPDEPKCEGCPKGDRCSQCQKLP